MSQHYPFDHNILYGSQLHEPLVAFEENLTKLTRIFGTMQQMLQPEDGSQDAHYAAIVLKFGFEGADEAAKLAAAHAAYNELQSGLGKIMGNGEVDHVADGLKQLFDRLR